jgi:hypothetical protein
LNNSFFFVRSELARIGGGIASWKHAGSGELIRDVIGSCSGSKRLSLTFFNRLNS